MYKFCLYCASYRRWACLVGRRFSQILIPFVGSCLVVSRPFYGGRSDVVTLAAVVSVPTSKVKLRFPRVDRRYSRHEVLCAWEWGSEGAVDWWGGDSQITMAAITRRPRRAPRCRQCRAVPARRLARHTPLFFQHFLRVWLQGWRSCYCGLCTRYIGGVSEISFFFNSRINSHYFNIASELCSSVVLELSSKHSIVFFSFWVNTTVTRKQCLSSLNWNCNSVLSGGYREHEGFHSSVWGCGRQTGASVRMETDVSCAEIAEEYTAPY